ncbi:MAG: type II toxin-antitoxin system PrlF family antitoxin [Azoarcus sp.]|nr:type II toxin-antitoxin system PrlF family antitoxin [Azoarcus sp.]
MQAKQESPRRCYTDDFKAQAVTLASSIGQEHAARKLGMPVKTLSHQVEADRQGKGGKFGKQSNSTCMNCLGLLIALPLSKGNRSNVMNIATLTSKGQITLPVAVRHGLKLETGSRIAFIAVAPGRYEVQAATLPVQALKGLIAKPARPVSVEDMNAAIRERAAKAIG